MTAFLGVLYLLVFLAAGCTCVRFLLPRKSLLTRVWLGVSLGLLLMMWLPALIAFAVDFTWTAHLLALIPLGFFTNLLVMGWLTTAVLLAVSFREVKVRRKPKLGHAAAHH